MGKKVLLIITAIIISFTSSGCYLFTPMVRIPRPASFNHLWQDVESGRLQPLEINPKNIYGMGITYAAHLKEVGAEFDPDTPPPVFKKELTALNKSGSPVRMPTRQDLIDAAEGIEAGLGARLAKDYKELNALLDYEGEMAFVLLEDVDWKSIKDPQYAPRLGWFLVNDLSARTIAILGDGKPTRYDYWGASKSFPGFLPVGQKMWIPNEHSPDSILSVVITTSVNGRVRQRQSTSDMMYTPREMLMYISQKYPDELPGKGDIVLTGTPGGVAMQVPAWKAWLANVLDLDRFMKLFFSIASGRSNKKFLKPGDRIVVSGGVLGELETSIVR